MFFSSGVRLHNRLLVFAPFQNCSLYVISLNSRGFFASFSLAFHSKLEKYKKALDIFISLLPCYLKKSRKEISWIEADKKASVVIMYIVLQLQQNVKKKKAEKRLTLPQNYGNPVGLFTV